MVRGQTTNGALGHEWTDQLQQATPDREVTVVDTSGLDEKASGDEQLAALQQNMT